MLSGLRKVNMKNKIEETINIKSRLERKDRHRERM
jgi:hypothetical protein